MKKIFLFTVFSSITLTVTAAEYDACKDKHQQEIELLKKKHAEEIYLLKKRLAQDIVSYQLQITSLRAALEQTRIIEKKEMERNRIKSDYDRHPLAIMHGYR